MECPECHAPTPIGALRCQKCNTPLDPGDETPTTVDGEAWDGRTPPTGPTMGATSAQHALQPGHILGGRYEILQLLGQGGMGAVYKALDREVERLVALKVIRPDLADHPDVVRRFKHELILARQVTHKNVIRIFDLGEAEGAKFISMEFIDGRDLKSIQDERGKLPPEDAAAIIEQVCRGLEAAHAGGRYPP